MRHEFFIGLSEKDWNGEGYTLKQPYIDGAEVTYEDQDWVYDRGKLDAQILPPREYRHTLSILFSGLIEQGFVVLHISDYSGFCPKPKVDLLKFLSQYGSYDENDTDLGYTYIYKDIGFYLWRDADPEQLIKEKQALDPSSSTYLEELKFYEKEIEEKHYFECVGVFVEGYFD